VPKAGRKLKRLEGTLPAAPEGGIVAWLRQAEGNLPPQTAVLRRTERIKNRYFIRWPTRFRPSRGVCGSGKDFSEGMSMSGFIAVGLTQFVKQYLRNNKEADANQVRAAVEDALAARRQGVRCACGNPIWVAGSAVAGYGCFTCITGSAEPDGDPEIDAACDGWFVETDDPADRIAQVSQIMKNHPRDYRERLEAAGFVWQNDETDLLYEQEAEEEGAAVPETDAQRRLVHFLDTGGIVTQPVLGAYLEERNSATANLPLIRKYFKQANPHLKAILLEGLAANPTDLDLLDDLSYFSEFDTMLGELIHYYTDACLKERDIERFSLLAQDFHMNTYAQGYDALHELITLFHSGRKGAVVQQLFEAIDEYAGVEDIPF
jgi:hypothetical protein